MKKGYLFFFITIVMYGMDAPEEQKSVKEILQKILENQANQQADLQKLQQEHRIQTITMQNLERDYKALRDRFPTRKQESEGTLKRLQEEIQIVQNMQRSLVEAQNAATKSLLESQNIAIRSLVDNCSLLDIVRQNSNFLHQQMDWSVTVLQRIVLSHQFLSTDLREIKERLQLQPSVNLAHQSDEYLPESDVAAAYMAAPPTVAPADLLQPYSEQAGATN